MARAVDDGGNDNNNCGESPSRWKRYGSLLAIKPVAILYALQNLVASKATHQLWVDKACYVNLGVCIDSILKNCRYVQDVPF